MRMRTVVKTTLDVGATALDLANNVGGVPFAGAAATLLSELGRSCDQVKVHKSDCQLLRRRAQTVLDALRDGTSGLEGTALQQSADELEMILEQINRRMSRWSNYNMLSAYLRRDEIARDLREGHQSLEAHLDKFHIRAQCSTHEMLSDAEKVHRRDQDETRALLDEVLANQQDILAAVRSAGEPVAANVMGAAQAEFHDQPRDSPRYFQYEKNILNLYNSTGVMPTLPNLSHEVVLKEKDAPVAGGTYSDVWLGTWLGTVEVALKSLRGVKVSLPQAQKRFEHEITVWHTLEHPNVLRFLGIVANLGPHIHVVSPWQSNGNALEYVKDPKVDRLKLLAGAARGVEYLHSRDKPVVHGNLKCANILVSDKGEALISDFGLSRIIEDITETAASATLTTSGSSRWCAPELMNGTSSPTLATDVYAFSMAILECLTSERPFAHLKRETTVVIEVVDEKRPPRPSARTWERWFTGELWKLMERCWSQDPSSRPDMTYVATELRDLGQGVAHRHLASSMFL